MGNLLESMGWGLFFFSPQLNYKEKKKAIYHINLQLLKSLHTKSHFQQGLSTPLCNTNFAAVAIPR